MSIHTERANKHTMTFIIPERENKYTQEGADEYTHEREHIYTKGDGG